MTTTIYGAGGTANGSVNYGLGGTASGTTIYTTEVSAGTAWTPVTFDGTNDYLLRGGDITGLSDGTTGTMAFRIEPATDGITKNIFRNSTTRVYILQSATNRYDIVLKNTAGATIFRQNPATTHITTDGAITVLVSWDLGGTPVSHFYREGVDQGSPSTEISGTIDYTGSTDWGLMAHSTGADKYDGDVTFFYFDDAYIDLSVEANRDKFLQANIGDTGDGPTGSDPLVYITGDASEWNDAGGINLGTGGAFTMNGAVTDA